jgi:SAM-dependent methyltransferase
MKNVEKWKPSLVIKTGRDRMRPIKRNIYRGSWTIAQCQAEAYPQALSFAKGKLLDCGCGDLPYFDFYRPLVQDIVALDIAEDLRHADIISDLANALPFEDATFDTVLLTDVIGHVPNAQLLFSECIRVLKYNGVLILTSPFMYWQTTTPYIYQYPGEPQYQRWCEVFHLEQLQFDSYGGYFDVQLDLLNKALHGPIGARITDVIRRVLKSSGILQANRRRTKYSYPLGYILVARKK